MDKLYSKFQVLLWTNDLLDRLVAIHNKIFSQSLWRIFKPVAYNEIAMELSALCEAINDAQSRYPHLDAEPLPGLNWSEVDETYSCFCESVIQTYSLLALICLRLYKKSGGEPYIAAAYNEDVAIYQSLVLEHQAIGQRLNSQVRDKRQASLPRD